MTHKLPLEFVFVCELDVNAPKQLAVYIRAQTDTNSGRLNDSDKTIIKTRVYSIDPRTNEFVPYDVTLYVAADIKKVE